MSISTITEKVRYLLWAKSAGRCQFDACNEPLWRDKITQIEMNFAEVAHIIGNSPQGPRGDATLSEEYCNDLNNLMLMCPRHHKMIDQILDVYSDDVLRQMKKAHEARIEQVTAITTDKTSQVVIYRGNVGAHLPKIDHRDAWQAMFPTWYPAGRLPIELGLSNSAFQDGEDLFWKIEEENLERQFDQKIKPLMSTQKERNHFSIFAMAPQPLLIKLGSLFSDIYPTEVYQLHRELPTWEWQSGPEKFTYSIEEPHSSSKRVAINLSLSATIDSARIKRVFDRNEFSEWKMTMANPNNDFLQSRGQLRLFRETFRKLLDNIKFQHGEAAIIHLFPAVPVSVAVEIGRVWQPKADLPIVIYDQNRSRDGFVRTLSIGV